MIVLLLLFALGQQPTALSGVVTDPTGAVVAGAVVTVTFGDTRQEVMSAADGTWTTNVPAGLQTVAVRVTAPGFAPTERAVTLPATTVRFELRPQAIAEAVTVSADSSTARLSVESSVTSIDRSAIAAAPAMRLDDQLRTVPGFSLFRRTTSAVANPTTQGVTLRGLSASGASRTLVVADDVPLNDPFGAWVYWDRVPVVALQRVDVIRGASGDIHGNDALGGVIRLTTRTSHGAEGWFDGGSLGTARGSGYGAVSHGTWMAGASAESMKTDGFIVVAPEARGAIDVPADSRSTSTMGWVGGTRGAFQATARGGYFTEQRGNGTPAQLNTTITRWTGVNAHGLLAGGVWDARGDVSLTDYHQTFSAVTAPVRAVERMTACSGSVHGRRRRVQLAASDVARAGAGRLHEPGRARGSRRSGVLPHRRAGRDDPHDGEAARQRRRVPGPVRSVAACHRRGRRADRPVDALQGGADDRPRATTLLPAARRRCRSGTPRQHAPRVVAHRVPHADDERAVPLVPRREHADQRQRQPGAGGIVGPEVAFTMQRERWTGRAIFYATRLDGAIYNRTVSSTPTAISRERANGDARAIGSELELEWRATRKLALTTAWAFNDSKFTSGELDGKRTPQVPRVGGSVGLRVNVGAFDAALNVRVIGEQFDDDINTFLLRRGSLVDARAGWRLSRRLELFGAIENALDEEIDTGKTPLRTIGAPRMARAGITARF